MQYLLNICTDYVYISLNFVGTGLLTKYRNPGEIYWTRYWKIVLVIWAQNYSTLWRLNTTIFHNSEKEKKNVFEINYLQRRV